VVPSLGLTEAHLIESDPAISINAYEPGSHLFWLHCPKPSGVTISVTRLNQTHSSDPKPTELRRLQEYQFASLVDLSRELTAGEAYGDTVLVTIIYTDN
jgi:hypothetical protein